MRCNIAKRFTDTNKYKKPFIRGLLGAYKILWDYLYHSCDHAGIWIVDFEIAQIYVGNDMPINEADALKYFNVDEIRILVISDGKKWFIIPFIQFQYGELNPANRAHKSVLDILKNNSIKPLIYTLQGCKDMDMDMDMDKVKERKKEKKNYKIELPPKLDTPEFKKTWDAWVQFRIEKKAKLTPSTIKVQLKKLSKLPVETTILMINQSIEQGWQGIFPLRETKADDKDDFMKKVMKDVADRDSREGKGIMAEIDTGGNIAPDENLF